MRGDKELKHVHAFTQVRFNRNLDRAPGGVGHVTAHPRQLFNLIDIASGTGLRHHVNRVVDAEFFLQGFGDFIRRRTPDADHCSVAPVFI